MIKVQLLLTVGVPGSRLDFVSGWLSTLPKFVDSRWYIDALTGRSFKADALLKEIDHVDYGDETMRRLLAFGEFELDADSNLILSQGCHGVGLLKKIKMQDAAAIKVIRINTRAVDPKKLFWEYLVKTYMSQQRYVHAIHQGHEYHVDLLLQQLDLEITDCNRIKYVEDVIEKLRGQSYTRPLPMIEKLQCIDIDYNNLFTPGGSKQLCKQLELEVDDRYHQHWDNNLTMCESPGVITRFGKIWSYATL
jgi:hypothetical protein